MSELRREIRFEPGYDFRDEKRGCHGMNIRFLLHGEHGTVQFLIYAGWLPGHTYGSQVIPPMGADVGYHWDAQRYERHKQMPCDLRPGGSCFYDGSSLQADELFTEFTRHGDAVVWKTLEERYASLDGAA